jgi:transposase InsO family protein
MCQVLKVSRSAYYGWNHKPTEREKEKARLTRVIRDVFFNSRRTYGSPKVYTKLKQMGYTISKNQVAAIMRKEGLRSVVKKKHIVTTDSKHNYPVAPNLLNQNFMVAGPGRVWVSDLTYIRTSKGWVYLTVIIDLWDRKVLGWSLSISLKAVNTVVPAWLMAVKNRPVTQELIFHSDRGIQYASNEFRKLLDGYSLVKRSMSRKGNCWDNAVAESFFKSLKMEWVYQRKYRSKMQAALSVFEYIESWYNTDRIHSALEMSIREFNAINNNHKLVA